MFKHGNMGNFTEKELIEILNKYGTLSDNGEETILDKILTSTDKLHEIKVSEIWEEPFKKIEQNNKISFTIDEEPFQVDKGTTWESFLREQNNQNPNYGLEGYKWWLYNSVNGHVLLFYEIISTGTYAMCDGLIRVEDHDDLGNYNDDVFIKKDDIISPGNYMVSGSHNVRNEESGFFN